MRYLAALALSLAACAADPVLLPDASTPDAGPCGGACGAGTACVGGACVAVDGGALDVPAGDAGGRIDTGPDAPQVEPVDVPAAPADTGPDAPACTSNTVGNCCGVACAVRPHTTAPACVSGRCGFSACADGYGDCDGNPANGCEVDVRASATNCGACGAPCAADRFCLEGACRPCPAGQHPTCPGSCADPQTDLTNCGACGNVCAPQNADARCSGGVCTHGACTGAYGDCDGNAANGCETNLSFDPANCGQCGRRCSGGMARCESSRCI